MAFHYSEPFEKLLDAPRPEGAPLATARVVVVGSGYGGSVAAFRLADLKTGNQGRDYQVLVLERGREYVLGDFPQNFDDLPTFARTTAAPQPTPGPTDDALFQIRIGTGVDAIVGSGLGGTSLINANVAAHPEPSIFSTPEWPERIRTESADPGTPFNKAFGKVAEFLNVSAEKDRQKWLEPLAKYQALAHYARALDFEVDTAPITVTLGAPRTYRVSSAGVRQDVCTYCGNCVTGCNVGAKNTLTMNLIPAAKQRGATFLTGGEVLRVESLQDGVKRGKPAWRIWVRAVVRETRVRCNGVYPIDADIVVLAAGALGSTEILQRSAAHHRLPCSPQLGQRFSTNGDALAMSFAESDLVQAIGQDNQHTPKKHCGPTITALARGRTKQGEPFTLEEGAVPASLTEPFGELVTTGAQFGRLGDSRLPGWFRTAAAKGADPLSVQPGAVENSQLFLIMGNDGAHGELKLTDDTQSTLDDAVSLPVWHAPRDSLVSSSKSQSNVDPSPLLSHVEKTLSQFDRKPQQKGGQYVNNPLWRLLPDSAAAAMAGQFPGGRLITVHPLGGCPMSDHGRTGVVNDIGQVYRGASAETHPGLFVLDGSIIPRALGINPFMTIASLAWRACDVILEQLGGEAGPYVPPEKPHCPPTLPSSKDQDAPPPRIIVREQLVGQLLRANRSATRAIGELLPRDRNGGGTKRLFAPNGLILRLRTDPAFELSKLTHPDKPISLHVELYRNDTAAQDSIKADAYGVSDDRLNPGTLIACGRGEFTVLNPAPPRGWIHKWVRAALAFAAYLGRRELPWDLMLSQWRRRGDSPVAKQPVWQVIGAFLDVASMHATYRDFDYMMKLWRAPGGTCDPATFVHPPYLTLKGRKRVSWRPRRARLWQALTQLETNVYLAASPRRVGRAKFRVDAEYLVGTGLMQIEEGTSVPRGIMSCAGFVARMARCAIQAGFWEFGAPEYPPSHKRPKCEPGLPPRLKNGWRLSTRRIQVPLSLPQQLSGDNGPAPTTHPQGTVPILLHTYRPEDDAGSTSREPVLLIHGLAQGSLIFAHPAMEVSMADYFVEKGFDVWLLDFRVSNQLSAQDVPDTGWSMDECGAYDVPIAVDALLENYLPGTRVHLFAHCVGSVAATMAILSGKLTNKQLKSVAINAIHPWTIPSPANAVRAKFAVFLRDRLSDEFYDPMIQSKDKISVVQSVIDRLGFSLARLGEDVDGGHCPTETATFANAICDRMTFLYGRMWTHERVEALHKHWKDLVGIGQGVVQRHLYYQLLHGRVVNREGLNVYLTKDNVKHWQGIRTLLMHGNNSRVFNPNSATQSAVRLREVLDALKKEAQDKREPPPPETPVGLRRIDGYGHMDVILADTAPEESYRYVKDFFCGAYDRDLVSRSQRELDPRPLPGIHGPDTTPVLTGPVLRAARLEGGDLVIRLWLEAPVDNTSPSVGIDFNIQPKSVDCIHEFDLEVGKQYRWFDITLPADAYKQISARSVPGGPVAAAFSARRELNLGLLKGLFSGREPASVLQEALATLHHGDSPPRVPAWLRHLKNPSPDCHFIVGSCRYPGTPFDSSGADQAFEGMLTLLETGIDCDLVFLVGDQIYADALGGILDPTPWRDIYIERYRAAFQSQAFAALMNTVPCHFAIDDHEFVDNYAGHEASQPESTPPPDREALEIALIRSSGMSKAQFLFARDASRAYISSARSHRPFGKSKACPKRFWYALDDTCEISCPAFILDTRAERERAKNGSPAKLMRPEQMDCFEGWLSAHSDDDRPKFIFLGSPIIPLVRDFAAKGDWMRQDGPTGYPDELGRIVQYIARNGIRRVVFVGGDPHLSCAGMLELTDLGESQRSVRALHIISSGLYAPLKFANLSPDDVDWTDGPQLPGRINLPGAGIAYQLSHLAGATPHFVHVSAVPDAKDWRIRVTAHDRDGEKIKRLEFPL